MLIQILTDDLRPLQQYKSYEGPVILLQDAVYVAKEIKVCYPGFDVYMLESEFLASGINKSDFYNIIQPEQWVELCANFHPVLTIQ